MIVADVLETFLDSLIFGGLVVSSSDDGTNTTLIVSDALYSRVGILITVNATDVAIISATFDDCGNDSITVAGVHSNPPDFVLQRPVFLHGTPYATNSHLSKARMSGETITPLIFLLEILESVDEGRQSPVETADIRLFFLDDSKVADWLTDDYYAEVITQMNRLADFIIVQAQLYKGFSHDFSVRKINHANWGQYANLKGYIQRIFNVNLSGVERRVNLPILKACNC